MKTLKFSRTKNVSCFTVKSIVSVLELQAWINFLTTYMSQIIETRLSVITENIYSSVINVPEQPSGVKLSVNCSAQ